MSTDDTTRALPALHEPAAPEPGATGVVPYEPALPATHGPRMRTLVFGLVLLTVSGTTAIRLLTHVHVDYGVVLLVLLLVAGAMLLAGGVLGAAREARSPRN